MNSQQPDPALVSIPNGGKQLAVGRSTTYQLINDGELETVKIGKRRLIVRASIDAYIERLRGLAEESPAEPVPPVSSLDERTAASLTGAEAEDDKAQVAAGAGG